MATDGPLPALPTSIATAPQYQWGAGCDGWHLLTSRDLSVIQERMPPGTSEARHAHTHAQQFFYVLDGTLSLEVNGTHHFLLARQGLHVQAGAPHRVFNNATEPAQFLVISQPPSHGDRQPAPDPPGERPGA